MKSHVTMPRAPPMLLACRSLAPSRGERGAVQGARRVYRPCPGTSLARALRRLAAGRVAGRRTVTRVTERACVMFINASCGGWKRLVAYKDVTTALETPHFISTTAVTFLAYHAPRALSMTVRAHSMTIVLSRSGQYVRFMTKGMRTPRYTRDKRAGRPSLVRA